MQRLFGQLEESLEASEGKSASLPMPSTAQRRKCQRSQHEPAWTERVMERPAVVNDIAALCPARTLGRVLRLGGRSASVALFVQYESCAIKSRRYVQSCTTCQFAACSTSSSSTVPALAIFSRWPAAHGGAILLTAA